jgi:signal transduction histidine kinase
MKQSMISGRNHISLILHSIRFRLALLFVILLGLVMLVFSVFIYTRQARDLRLVAIANLDVNIKRLAGFVGFVDRGNFGQLPQSVPSDPQSGESFVHQGDVLAFLDGNGQVIQSWGPLGNENVSQLIPKNLPLETMGRPPTAQFVSSRPSSGGAKLNYVFAILPFAPERRLAGFLLLGTPIDPDHQLTRLMVSLGLGILITLSLALLGGFWLADRAMRPVKQITEAARTISETDLNLRLNLNRKDELGELANTFDGMLARLQVAFERQRQFTADASHELRTPLTIVELETSRSLEAKRSSQEYQDAMKVIHSENQFMIRLVNNLLTLARMDAGQVVLQRELLDLSDIALEVVERLASLATKNQVRLSAGDLPELSVMGDHAYLMQMLTNLVENAIKYTRGEDGRVLVTAGSRLSNQGSVAWVQITDTGPGIPTEHLARLFDRFYQVDKARTRQELVQSGDSDEAPSGAGLGLAIAQWIAHAHGGEISVQSELGKGSTFEVRLPLVSPPPGSEEEIEAPVG